MCFSGYQEAPLEKTRTSKIYRERIDRAFDCVVGYINQANSFIPDDTLPFEKINQLLVEVTQQAHDWVAVTAIVDPKNKSFFGRLQHILIANTPTATRLTW